MLLFTLHMAILGIIEVGKNGFYDFAKGNFIYIIFFFIYLLLDVWILRATFLPVIKISEKGISAISLFRNRHMSWDEIKTVKLLKASNRRSGGKLGSAWGSFEITDEAETKGNAMTNKVVRVNTFIVVSKVNYKTPPSLSLSGQLLTHEKITIAEEIAFAYESKAWDIIQTRCAIYGHQFKTAENQG